MIDRQNYLVLNKSEWDRLRRKPIPDNVDHKREEYFKALNEQSQKLMKFWPGQAYYQRKEHKKIENSKLIEKLKNITLKKKQDNTDDAIKTAKELVFANSCYGRQLLSALLESKTLEERDLQIKFQKELVEKSNALKVNEPQGTSLLDSKQMEIDETRIKLRRNQIAKEIVKYNVAVVEMQKEKRRKEKEENKLELLEDVRLNNEFMKKSAEIELKMAYQEKQAIKEYEAENKKIKDYRAKREEKDELKREIWRKYQDRIKYREKDVLNKIHHEKCELPEYQKVFKMIQNSEEGKNKKYDVFVQKGIERLLDRSNKREQKEIENRIYLRNERKLLDEENKIQADVQNRRRTQEMNKYECNRQCILPKYYGATKQEAVPRKKDASASSFFVPKNKHLEGLKARRVEPTHWSALNAAHEQFSQHASKTLHECRYKTPARKVVDNYRRLNGLDSETLPVSNYN